MHILISFAIHSFIHICIILQIFESTFQLSTNRGALCVQIAHASKAPCIPMKFGNLSIREILMITWPFVCQSIRTTGKPMWNAKLSELVWESITCVSLDDQLIATKTNSIIALGMKQMFVSRWTHPGLIYVLFLKNSTFSIAIYI